jgi:hypothetical protein
MLALLYRLIRLRAMYLIAVRIFRFVKAKRAERRGF